LEIKKLITLAETSKQAEGTAFADNFLSLTNRVHSTTTKNSGLSLSAKERVDDEEDM